ncbi:MAG: hypothetical protein R2771_04170 [Saprospiraceae bacterium]
MMWLAMTLGKQIFNVILTLKLMMALHFSLETEMVLPGGGINKEGKYIDISPFKSYIGIKRNSGSGWRENYFVQ